MTKIHLIDTDGKYIEGGGTLCKKAIIGDRAISINQALNPEINLPYNCNDCFEIFTSKLAEINEEQQ